MKWGDLFGFFVSLLAMVALGILAGAALRQDFTLSPELQRHICYLSSIGGLIAACGALFFEIRVLRNPPRRDL